MRVVELSRRRSGRAVPALVRAFWDYPESRHLLPAERARRRALPRFLAEDCADAASFGTLLAVEDGDVVVAAAAWLPPHAYPVAWPRQLRQALRLLPALPWAAGALNEALRGRSAVRAGHPSDPHFFLRSIGVDPARQRAGAGSMLMRPMLDRADREGMGCHLTTADEANVAWYGRFGFSVRSVFHPTPSWPTVWSLWRPPAPP